MQNLQQRTGALLLDAHTQELRRIARADKNYWPGKSLIDWPRDGRSEIRSGEDHKSFGRVKRHGNILIVTA